jgi:ubiquinone/menaquinone biosynthesis C-methylase UbiE
VSEAFDPVAIHYDKEFTHSRVGKKQRERVWTLLTQSQLLNKKLQVLEVNCGTGEDALRFAHLGHHVLASDVSGQMIEVANAKKTLSDSENVEFVRKGFQGLMDLGKKGPFDLVFSNFGGLNCATPKEFVQFLETIHSLLQPEGSLIAVVMPKFCLWESCYYLIKNPSHAFRRLQDKVTARIGSNELDVFYYSPLQVKKMSTELYTCRKIAPVGLFLPPSYLEHFFKNKPKGLDLMEKWESILPASEFLAGMSDHYFIHLERK